MTKPAPKTSAHAKVTKPGGIQGYEANATELAAWLGLTRQRVIQLEAEGALHRGASGKWPLQRNVLAYLEYHRDERRRASKTATASRVQEARAREIELRTAREAHRLIETDEALGFVDEALGMLKAGMAGVPASVTRDLDMRATIGAAIDEQFRRVADHYQQAAAALRSGGTAAASDPEDDA